MREFKFVVENQDHGRKIQDILFANGYEWRHPNKKEYSKAQYNYLYTDTENKITHGRNEQNFEESSQRESKILDRKQYDMLLWILTNSTPDTSKGIGQIIQRVVTYHIYAVCDMELLNNLRKMYIQDGV